MVEIIPFARVTFHVSIGVAIVGQKRCAVMIDVNEPTNLIFKPRNDERYVTYYRYAFESQKKIPFAAIIGALIANDITPQDGINHPINPDNLHYFDLPYSRLEEIMEIIRLVLNGITLGWNRIPNYRLFTYSQIERETAICEMERQMISMDQPAAIILEGCAKIGTYTVNIFRTKDIDSYSENQTIRNDEVA